MSDNNESFQEITLNPEFVSSLLKELLGEDISKDKKAKIQKKLTEIYTITKTISEALEK